LLNIKHFEYELLYFALALDCATRVEELDKKARVHSLIDPRKTLSDIFRATCHRSVSVFCNEYTLSD
jgi:hypothetical protein